MPSDPDQKSRDALICQRYLNEKISAERLGLDVGISAIRVRQILKANGITRQSRDPSLQPEGDKTLSALHVKLGKVVLKYRAIELGVERSYLAEKMNWSPQKLASVENGTFNVTLMDLQDLATIFESTLAELLESTEISEGDS